MTDEKFVPPSHKSDLPGIVFCPWCHVDSTDETEEKINLEAMDQYSQYNEWSDNSFFVTCNTCNKRFKANREVEYIYHFTTIGIPEEDPRRIPPKEIKSALYHTAFKYFISNNYIGYWWKYTVYYRCKKRFRLL